MPKGLITVDIGIYSSSSVIFNSVFTAFVISDVTTSPNLLFNESFLIMF